MTNKPMLSVERELLERASRQLLDWECADDGDEVKRTFVELRALLDEPIPFPGYPPVPDDRKLPAAQHQGETVAWRYHDEAGVSSWFDGAPDQRSLDFVAGRGGCIDLSFSKAAEQPAPVAVVMPERKTKADYSGYIEQFQSEAASLYNSALDDVARLNGVKP